MLRPCLVAVTAILAAAGCAGQGAPLTGTGGSTGTAGNGSGTAGNGGPGTAGSGPGTAGSAPGTAGNTGTAGDSGGPGTGGSGPMVTPPKDALTDPQPCTTTGTPVPRKLWRLSGPAFTASIRAIFNDTAGAAPIATVFSDPVNLGFSIDANALLVQGLN